MSLINSMMDVCVILDKQHVPDDEGGFTTKWVDGAEISVAITNDTSIQTRIAQAEGFMNTYTLTMDKANVLEFHDVIKRKSDGLILRVTSDTVMFPSIASSQLNRYAQVTAEKWSLPND